MSKQKLTLSVEERLVERAKRFSERNETSVSRLVSDLFESLDDEAETSTVVDRLRGIMKRDGSWEDYKEHLRRKHLG